MTMLLVKEGSFVMGADKGEPDMAPAHPVQLSAYYLGACEVPKSLFRRFAVETGIGISAEELDPTANQERAGKPNTRWRYWAAPDDEYPIFSITWEEAADFCSWLSRAEGMTYRLPTEAEWEYAARAGTKTTYWWGNGDKQEMRNEDQDLNRPYRRFVKSGTYPANPWGFYEVLGNSFEWVWDWYAVDGYAKSFSVNPTGPATGTVHLARGGSAFSHPSGCNLFFRSYESVPNSQGGLRVVCEITPGFTVPPQPELPKLPTDLAERAEHAKHIPHEHVSLAPGVDLELIEVSPGEVEIGSPEAERGHSQLYESPRTNAKISRGFSMGVYEITQAQYQAVMGENPSHFPAPNKPIEGIKPIQAFLFCEKLTVQEHRTGRLAKNAIYRLPTDAEWEYVCRAGSHSAFCYGNDSSYLGFYGTFDTLSGPSPVGGKLPNDWGFYDMHGNVSEVVCGTLIPYPGGTVTDPLFTRSDGHPSSRGGGWNFLAEACRSAFRRSVSNGDTYDFVGFRVLRSNPGDDTFPPYTK